MAYTRGMQASSETLFWDTVETNQDYAAELQSQAIK